MVTPYAAIPKTAARHRRRDSHTGYERDRERVRDGETSHSPHEGRASQDTARLVVFKLVMAASKTWRRLRGQNQLPKVIDGVKFKDGIEEAADVKSAACFTPSPSPHYAAR